MSDILEQLYHGEISPWTQRIPPSPYQMALICQIDELRRQFLSGKTPEDAKMLEMLENKLTEAEDPMLSQAFAQGFSLACQLFLAGAGIR